MLNLVFEDIINFAVDAYSTIYNSSAVILSFFLQDIDPEILEFLELPLGTTYLELILGVSLPLVLFLILYNFIKRVMLTG